MSSTLAIIRKQRLDKIKKLKKLGIDPYPAKSNRTHTNKELLDNFKKIENETVSTVGRIMSWREHGKLRFAHIQDFTGKIQLIIKFDTILPLDKEKQTLGWGELSLLDVGDFVQAKGKLILSKTNEISVEVDELKILAKSIRPLPDKWEGIKDPELVFRRRYLDLVMNPERKEMFLRKSKFWQASRYYLKSKGFIEVETPILEHVTGGGDAKPFVTHHNALNEDFYLRISTELYLKRLIGGGFEKIFTLGPNFRNEGIDEEHLQEYMQIEWYMAYADYKDNMNLVKEMLRYIAKTVYGTTKFKKDNYEFDLNDKWKEIDYVKIIKEKFEIDIFSSTEEEMFRVLKKNKINLDIGVINRSRLVDNLWKLIRKTISGPAFLINEPKFMSPLAKSNPNNPDITQRFHVLIAGSELVNGYSEINDPVDQLERFKIQQAARNAGDDEAQMLDIDYVEMLEYGMPPTSGVGQSERIFWFFEGVTAREGTFFPQNKFSLDEVTKEIYNIKEVSKLGAKTSDKFQNAKSLLKSRILTRDIGFIKDKKIVMVDENLYKKYKNINIGVAIIKGVNITKSLPELGSLRKDVIQTIQKNLNPSEVDNLINIKSYHDMYIQMNVDTRSRKSSPEALLRRIVEGKELYSVNTCVDAYNLEVILNQVSAGAFDLDKMKLPILVRESKEGEKIEIIGGETKTLKQGEVCYYDEIGAYNMDFNYRDSERTKITENTKNLIINVEGVNDIPFENVKEALLLTVNLITEFCGGKVKLMGMTKPTNI